MKDQRLYFASAAVLAIACGTATIEGGEAPAPADDLAQTEQGLELKVREHFGPDARVGQVFGRGDQVLLGVALEPAAEESDVPVPLAVARFDRTSSALTVVSATAEYREARLLGPALALVNAEGELKLRDGEGAERVLATRVKGEVSQAPNGGLLFTADADEGKEGDTAVMIAAPDGALKMVADAEGADDRGSVSPDGQTVVFVSGRTGVASLFRTTVDGAEPVQLTNAGLEPGRDDDSAPVGFVPPPMGADALVWVSADAVRFDAGGGEYWRVDVRTGVATREGGAQ